MHIAIRKNIKLTEAELGLYNLSCHLAKNPYWQEKKKLRKNNKITQNKGWGHDSVGNGSDPKHPVKAGVLFQQWATTPTLSQPLQGAGFMETG